MNATKILFALLLPLSTMLMGCQPLQAGVDGQREFSRNLASDLNVEAKRVVERGGGSADASFCVPGGQTHECLFVRSPEALPACPLFQSMENCLAIDVRSSLLARSELRRLVVEGTADYCSYSRGAIGQGNVEEVRSLGCVDPGQGFQRSYHGQPLICVLALDDEGRVEERFSVRAGRTVHNEWCDSVDPR